MVTDSDKMEAVLDNPYILITDKKISSIQEILPVLEQVVQQSKPILIVAEDVEGEAQATLVEWPDNTVDTIQHSGTLGRYALVIKYGWFAFLPPLAFGFMEATIHGSYPIYALRTGIEQQMILGSWLVQRQNQVHPG